MSMSLDGATDKPPRGVRELLLQIHLWLGLATGLVLAVVCLTGSILAFQTEIEMALHPEHYTVVPSGPRLPLDELLRRAQEAQPELRFVQVTVHEDPTRSVELGIGRRDNLFVHPSTGEVLGRYKFSETFLFQIFSLHRWLLAGDTGKMIVGTSTLLFLVILVSGLILWWPRNRKELRQRLRVARTKNVARLLYDLHVSLGFYAMPVLFVLAFTGLAWSFTWFHEAVYYVTGSLPESTPTPQVEPTETPISFEAAYALGRAQLGPTTKITIARPREATEAWSVRGLPVERPHDHATDVLYVDPGTSQPIGFDRYAERSLGSRVRTTFYPIHVGTIFGWPTRIIAFVASLLGFTFPLTGFLMWFRKWRGKRKKAAR